MTQAQDSSKSLKKKVAEYWNEQTCGTEFINKKKFTKEYFESIESYRYSVEPEIFSFAQFTRFKHKKILEVGVGAGTDFLQWVRAGAEAHGIDLTEEAISHVKHRMELYKENKFELSVGDAENLSYQDSSFDLVYSWGVVHHSPNTEKCLAEIVRVTKPGGTIKLMIYNRRSLFAFYMWLRFAMLKGKPFKSIKTVLFQNQESPGTKAYTIKEAKKMMLDENVKVKEIKAVATKHDLLFYKNWLVRSLATTAASIFGWNRCGWFMTIELEKVNK